MPAGALWAACTRPGIRLHPLCGPDPGQAVIANVHSGVLLRPACTPLGAANSRAVSLQAPWPCALWPCQGTAHAPGSPAPADLQAWRALTGDVHFLGARGREGGPHRLLVAVWRVAAACSAGGQRTAGTMSLTCRHPTLNLCTARHARPVDGGLKPMTPRNTSSEPAAAGDCKQRMGSPSFPGRPPVVTSTLVTAMAPYTLASVRHLSAQ